MAKLLIIADDLTGALDAGVQLAKRGVSTLVLPCVQDVPEAWQNKVVVMNTESRHATRHAAEEAISRTVAIGRKHDVPHFYKKTDSTLRGNLGSELQALLRCTRAGRLAFVPAFPRLGRTTVDGIQYVDGIELHETQYALDPLNPIRTSVVAVLVGEQADAEIHSIAIRQLESLNNDNENGIYIFDCRDEKELWKIGSAVSRLGWTTALAGSAGFADCLADLLGLIHPTQAKERLPSQRTKIVCREPWLALGTWLPLQAPAKLPRRILIVNGSMNPAAAQQLSYMEEMGHPTHFIDSLDMQRADEIIRAIEIESADYVVLSSKALRTSPPNLPAQTSDAMLRFAENFGRVVAEVIERVDFQLMIVFGGDTLAGIARAMECTSIVPLAEILPGVALSRIRGRKKEIFVISKAGGFGREDILQRLMQGVRRLQS